MKRVEDATRRAEDAEGRVRALGAEREEQDIRLQGCRKKDRQMIKELQAKLQRFSGKDGVATVNPFLETDLNAIAEHMGALQEENWDLVEQVRLLGDELLRVQRELRTWQSDTIRAYVAQAHCGRTDAQRDAEREKRRVEEGGFFSRFFAKQDDDVAEKTRAVLEDTILENLQLSIRRWCHFLMLLLLLALLLLMLMIQFGKSNVQI